MRLEVPVLRRMQVQPLHLQALQLLNPISVSASGRSAGRTHGVPALLAAAGLLALSAPAQVAAQRMDMPGMAMPERSPR